MKREFAALVLALITLVGFYYLVLSGMHAVLKTVVIVVLLLACSFSLQRLLGIEGEYGLLLIRTKKGLKLIDKIAKAAPEFWRFLANLGLVMGFGLCSLFLFRNHIPKKTVVVGMVCLLLFTQFVFPLAGPLVVELIHIEGLEQQYASVQSVAQTAASPGLDPISILITVISVLTSLSITVGGIALAGAIALIANALVTLAKISLFLFTVASGASDGTILENVSPGAAPVLPGINIPLVEGVLALIVLLVVHEGAHGILARVEGIRIKSAGMVFFGVLPFGAFVDPDEKQMMKMEDGAQTRVLVAGSTANLLTATLFFFLFIAFYYSVLAVYPSTMVNTPYVKVIGVTANGTALGFIEPGMKLLNWRGTDIHTLEDFKTAANGTVEGDIVNITTNTGTFYLRAGADGKVGVVAMQSKYTFGDYIRELSVRKPILLNVFEFIGLTFVLNVLIAIVNLLPLPLFDGYRMILLKLGKKNLFWKVKAIDVVVALIAAAFIANLLPWLWS